MQTTSIGDAANNHSETALNLISRGEKISEFENFFPKYLGPEDDTKVTCPSSYFLEIYYSHRQNGWQILL